MFIPESTPASADTAGPPASESRFEVVHPSDSAPASQAQRPTDLPNMSEIIAHVTGGPARKNGT
jgi:hypothetical protein